MDRIYKNISEICDIVTDFVAAGSFASLRKNVQYLDKPDYAQLIRTTDLKHKFLNNDYVYVSKASFDFLYRVNLNEESLILPNVGVNCGEVYYIGKNTLPYKENVLGPNAILVRTHSENNKYLYYCFQGYQFQSQLKNIVNAVAQPKYNKTAFKTLTVPLPSLPEQQKIAAHLDSIQSAIDNKKQQLQQLDELVKSKFVEMFGENPVESGKWKVEKLGDLCSKISDGVHAKPEYTETGMPFISVVNMNTGKLSFDDCKYVSVEAYEKMIKSTNPEKDDILYTKVGATYGISALVDTDKKFCLYVSVALLKPLHDKIDSQFLTSTMMMPYVKQQADNSIKGIGVPDLHLNQIRAFKIAVPPIELQNIFAEYVQKIDSAKSLIKTQLIDLQELMDSKMDEYFGE